MKRKLVIVLLLLFAISFASAQLSGLENQIEDVSGNLEGNVTKIREITERDKWDFIGSQWKELLLKNKAVAGIDAFFTKINIVFVVLFAHDWDFSLGLLFVFLIWLFTLLSFVTYARLKFDNGWTVFLVSLGATLVFAHARIFNYLSNGAVKVFLYKPSAGWRLLILAVEILALFAYLKLNQFISKNLKKAKEKRKKELLEEKVESTERFQKNMVKTAKEVMDVS